jgi:outer membrane protein insertion porin family
MAVSCTIPKKFQKGKPFVYKTTIDIEGNIPSSEKQKLKSGLEIQLDDSLKVRKVLAIGFPALFYNKLSKPPIFDSVSISRSKTFMTAGLSSRGYFSPQITDTFTVDTVGEQIRVKVRFLVVPGKQLKFDSITYELTTPGLQQLALGSMNQSVLKKGDPYSLQTISAELDRLLLIFRDNGYYKIAKEDFTAEQDTVLAALIDPTLDPFEQVRLLEELNKKKENPTIKIAIKQRPPRDSSHLNQYYIGKVNVFPDMENIDDTSTASKQAAVYEGYHFYFNSRKFRRSYLARNISLKTDSLYKQSNYFTTVNSFNNAGAWQQVDIELRERLDSTVSVLDADIQLFPARKQSMNIDFETSRNAGDYLTTGQLFGIGLNLGLLNRNAFREAVQSSSNLRFGIELGKDIIQTLQLSASQNFYVPRFILPFKIKNEKKLIAPRTIVNLGAAYTSRKDLFDVRSANGSISYEWTRKNHTWRYYPLNVEYTDVVKKPAFQKLEDSIPFLRIAFNNGLIMSQILSYTTGRATEDNIWIFKAQLEESGALFGMIRDLERGALRRFVKADIEYKYLINQPNKKSVWAFRIFGGYGYSYGKTGNDPEISLPFFKAYFGGGPYSMRAWQVRQLGPGSNIYYDTLTTSGNVGIDRFGDIKLEGNVEYRFNLLTLWGVKLKSALFVDFGNIWTRSTFGDPKFEGSDFQIGNLYKDLAVGGGTSLRIDFDFFLIRLDWAYKLKDPLFSNDRNGWFHKLQINQGQLQFGIGYPF